MGFFDFFKRKDNSKSKEIDSQYMLSRSLDILNNEGATIDDVKKFLRETGHDETETNLIAERADELYRKQLATENKEENLFDNIYKYSEYIISFLGLQQQGSYAPIAAYEKPDGEIAGFLYLIGKDDSYSLTAPEVVEKMENDYAQKLKDDAIESYVILYHSAFAYDNNHIPANAEQDFKAVSVAYHFKNGLHGKFGIAYKFDQEGPVYETIENFSTEENQRIFSTQLKAGKEYYQEKEEIKSPVFENSIGLKIKKSNNLDLSNTWAGIFGFESYRNANEGTILVELLAAAQLLKPVYSTNTIKVFEDQFEGLAYKAVYANGSPKTILPVIKTDYWVDVENLEINEWENMDSLEAIISARGRETFGLNYFATDYAENRELYLSQKKLNIRISGIVFVLDLHHKESWEKRDLQLSDNFTMYMPGQNLANYACFDFVGEIEDIREITVLEVMNLKAYIMNVRLITHPEIADFFTIDMYVTPENMRFKKLTKGMKVTGMFQMQGQIAK